MSQRLKSKYTMKLTVKFISKGFSLVELSIVILILGIMTTATLNIYNTKAEIQKYQKTKNEMLVIQDALSTFFAVRGRLPCPADPSAAKSNTTFGKEQIDTSTQPASCKTTGTGMLSGALSSDVQYYGAVPTRTLGLPDSYISDEFNNRFGYVVQKAFINALAFNTKCLPGHKALDENTSQKYVCFRAQASGSTNLSTPDLEIRNDYLGSYISRDPVYVLISHGVNGYGAFKKNADGSGSNTDRNSTPPVANQAELRNTNCNTAGACTTTGLTQDYVVKPKSNTFDDVVMYDNRNSLLSACNLYAGQICTNFHKIYPK